MLLATGMVEHVAIESDGYHYHVTVVSDIFSEKSKLLRQKWVYAQLKQYITAGSLHALQMKTWTISEWEKQRG